jgi:hypothetical protein
MVSVERRRGCLAARRLAIRYLHSRIVEWIAQATLKGEQEIRAAKQKERDDKLARASRR